MSVWLTSQEDKVCMFDSVTGIAFGPVFDSEEECESFTVWYKETTNFLPSPFSPTESWQQAMVRWEQHLEWMMQMGSG